MTKPKAQLDPMTDKWRRRTPVDNSYSDFLATMHSLDLAVHPWPLRDDRLRYRDTAYLETKMFLDKGSDGYFVEFP